MNLVEKLIDEADIIDERIIKIDHLLNHNINVKLLDEIAKDIANKVENLGVSKILTIETGGISLATLVSTHLNYIDVVYAKKDTSLITTENAYNSIVDSFTKQKKFNLTVCDKYLSSTDKILIVDDFLATGSAYFALLDICKQANCDVLKSCFIFNKTFQNNVTDDIYSLVNIKSLENNKIHTL